MRTSAILVALAIGTAAVAAPLVLTVGTRFEFTDCSSSGSSAQSVTKASYLMRVTDSDVFVCLAATCAAGGEKFPVGTVLLVDFPETTQSVSCRSTGSAGDVILTKASG